MLISHMHLKFPYSSKTVNAFTYFFIVVTYVLESCICVVLVFLCLEKISMLKL